MKKIDYSKIQLNAGDVAKLSDYEKTFPKNSGMHKVWHTDSEGKYWSGNWYYRTPKELLDECRSTITDLIINHPELIK